MTTRYFRVLFWILVIELITIISLAQATTGAFLGFVTDPSGAALKGAKITATNEATGLTRTVTTNSSGEYVIALLPVGRYTLTFEASQRSDIGARSEGQDCCRAGSRPDHRSYHD
jgi:hypothetical protein